MSEITLPSSIEEAARELGSAIHDIPVVQAFLNACADVENDPELATMISELDKLYNEMNNRHLGGTAPTREAINRFYKLREQVVYHPRMQARDAAEKALKAAFRQIALSISSVLTMDYARLAG